MITAGIDIGSLSTKSAILENGTTILAKDVVFTGADNRASAEMTFQNCLTAAELEKEDINYVITTGYGRENVDFSNKYISEIVCHAKGMHYLNPQIRMILDIGGQDSKAIQIDENGKVLNFTMNDKCAAGCGRFIEIITQKLGLALEELGDIHQSCEQTAKISSMCTVFAETEVVSLVAVGTPVAEIIRGVHDSIAMRAVSLMKTVGIVEPIGMTGGVAMNRGVISSLQNQLNKEVTVSQYPQLAGAIGAAFIGFEQMGSRS